MNYRLYPLSRGMDAKDLYGETPQKNPIAAKLSASLNTLKRHHIQNSEQRFDKRLLRYYKNQHILHELEDTGLTNFDLHRRESKHIIRYLHPYEHVKAAVRGKLPDGGWALIVATNLRVIFLHDIPLFSNMEEISYDLVSGVTCNQIGNFYASITLSTRSHDYELSFVSLSAARKFVDFLEKMAVDRETVKEQIASQMNKVRSLQA